GLENEETGGCGARPGGFDVNDDRHRGIKNLVDDFSSGLEQPAGRAQLDQHGLVFVAGSFRQSPPDIFVGDGLNCVVDHDLQNFGRCDVGNVQQKKGQDEIEGQKSAWQLHGFGSGCAFSASLAAMARFRARAEPFEGSIRKARLTLSAAASALFSRKSSRPITKSGSAKGLSRRAAAAAARAPVASRFASRTRAGPQFAPAFLLSRDSPSPNSFSDFCKNPCPNNSCACVTWYRA